MTQDPNIAAILAGTESVAPPDETEKEKKPPSRPTLRPRRRGRPPGIPQNSSHYAKTKNELALIATNAGVPAFVEKSRAPDVPHLNVGTEAIKVWGKVAAHRARFQVMERLQQCAAYASMDAYGRNRDEPEPERVVPVVYHRKGESEYTVTMFAKEFFELLALADKWLVEHAGDSET